MQIDLVQGMMDCLYAECTPCITDCVMAELEKLGQKYRVALKVAKVRHHLSSLMQCARGGVIERVWKLQLTVLQQTSGMTQQLHVQTCPCSHMTKPALLPALTASVGFGSAEKLF